MNNPLQLTSNIIPPNIPVETYEWTINPAPTDQDGEELELDLNEEHLLLPAAATNEQNINVSLVVEFGDGSKDSVAYPITLQENNLQANFMPQIQLPVTNVLT
ncbi:hypothetical protein QWY93_18755 [Echinicola jeungdonensis]|uniref:hypothetical protein n=1 Tax=Echinicola jeungdonensis TaxID=709343 RepID=UPI0025B52AAC|nr:hypothetical protein [Echinicola jeungdonensis]MDN3671314.1 hypothetical protein [Echinicola jeungdonensis]